MASIDENIFSDPLTATTKHLIAEALWGPRLIVQQFSNGERSQEMKLDAYFRFYMASCARTLHSSGSQIQTHRQLMHIVQQLRSGCTRDTIRDSISSLDPLCHADATIDLAAQLLLMLNFTTPRYAISGTNRVLWTDGAVESSVQQYFSSPPTLIDTSVTLDTDFTGYNIEKVAGIGIFWTDNLADHLRLIEGERKVAIFHHVTFLECQQNSLLPRDLVKETLRTISLLFPEGDRNTARKYRSNTDIDGRVLRCGQLHGMQRDINYFFHWRDRVVMLKQKYDDTHPKTINQWWWDRRNGVQWYTFWVAILILILTTLFGLVQSVEGALQVYKAFVPA
ncbi:hypothetical protein BDW68DRAFT_190839 [Aspergillus falconensis]